MDGTDVRLCRRRESRQPGRDFPAFWQKYIDALSHATSGGGFSVPSATRPAAPRGSWPDNIPPLEWPELTQADIDSISAARPTEDLFPEETLNRAFDTLWAQWLRDHSHRPPQSGGEFWTVEDHDDEGDAWFAGPKDVEDFWTEVAEFIANYPDSEKPGYDPVTGEYDNAAWDALQQSIYDKGALRVRELFGGEHTTQPSFSSEDAYWASFERFISDYPISERPGFNPYTGKYDQDAWADLVEDLAYEWDIVWHHRQHADEVHPYASAAALPVDVEQQAAAAPLPSDGDDDVAAPEPPLMAYGPPPAAPEPPLMAFGPPPARVTFEEVQQLASAAPLPGDDDVQEHRISRRHTRGAKTRRRNSEDGEPQSAGDIADTLIARKPRYFGSNMMEPYTADDVRALSRGADITEEAAIRFLRVGPWERRHSWGTNRAGGDNPPFFDAEGRFDLQDAIHEALRLKHNPAYEHIFHSSADPFYEEGQVWDFLTKGEYGEVLTGQRGLSADDLRAMYEDLVAAIAYMRDNKMGSSLSMYQLLRDLAKLAWHMKSRGITPWSTSKAKSAGHFATVRSAAECSGGYSKQIKKLVEWLKSFIWSSDSDPSGDSRLRRRERDDGLRVWAVRGEGDLGGL